MTKAELIEAVAKAGGPDVSKRKVAEIVDQVFQNLGKTLKKDKRFSYPGFGTWEVRMRKARKGRNPQTGAEIKIKASKTVGFKPHKALKASL